MPANVAVAVHVFPALVQSPENATVAEPAAAGLTDAVAVNAPPVYTNGPPPNVTEVVVGTLSIVMLALALLDAKFALPANVAVAWQLFPALVQLPGYETVAVPAAAGLTDAIAVNGLPLYMNGPAPKLTVVVLGALAMVMLAVAELPAWVASPAKVAVAVQLLPAFVQSPVYAMVALPEGVTVDVAVNAEPL